MSIRETLEQLELDALAPEAAKSARSRGRPVSYTHLTLPTILRV